MYGRFYLPCSVASLSVSYPSFMLRKSIPSGRSAILMKRKMQRKKLVRGRSFLRRCVCLSCLSISLLSYWLLFRCFLRIYLLVRHRFLWLLSAGFGLFIVGWFYYRFDPERCMWMPQCIFHRLTGWSCPACGAQRAFHHLLHGHFLGAFRFNPFMILSVPYFFAVVWTTFDHRSLAAHWRERVQHPCVVRLYFVLVLMWWIGRNFFGI